MACAEPAGLLGRTLELAGRRCRISVDDPAWLDHVEHSCARYRVAAGSPGARLYLTSRPARLPDDARALLALAEGADDRGAWVGRRAGATISVESRKWLVVSAGLAVCWIRQPVASPAAFHYNHLHPLLIEWLARSGALYLHAGAVHHPAAGTLLIAGPRHAGKTTTCLALLVAGSGGFLSDDTALIDGRGALHTLLRPMHPDRRLCEAWSAQLARRGIAAGDLAPLADGRVDLDPARWFADRVVDRLAPPRAVILPWADGAATTRCERVGPAHAAAVMLAQLHAGVPPLDGALADRIAALVALPALRLEIGRDAFADPEPVWRALGRGLAGLRR